MLTIWIYSLTYHGLDICHQMIKTGPDNTDQLATSIDCHRVRPLVVVPIPLLHASLHLSCVVGSQGQVLETTTSGHGTRGDEVIEGETVEGPKCTPQTLHGLIDCLSQWIDSIGIVTGGLSVLDIVSHLELLEALR